MKNAILFLASFLTIGMATSCQKEDIVPQVQPLALEKVEMVNDQPTQGIVREVWQLCDADAKVTKGKPNTAGVRTLTLYANGSITPVKFRSINSGALPQAIKDFINDQLNGYVIEQAWRSTNIPGQYLIEFAGEENIALYINSNGEVICKGTH